jgi:hypothetical protein
MNRSYIENQTGHRVAKSGNKYSVDGITVSSWSESKALESIWWQWWNRQKEKVLSRDFYKCVKCGDIKSLSVDHIVNRSQGGNSLMDNLQTLCLKCHDDKTNNRS